MLGPASAGAATFCVHAPAGCSGTTEPTIQAAVDAAAPDGGGTILVGGSGSQTPATPEAVRIGAGNAVTIQGTADQYGYDPIVALGGAAPGTAPLTVAEPGAVVRDLYLQDMTSATGASVDLLAGTLDHVLVSSTGSAVTAVHLVAGTLQHGTVDAGSGTGMRADGGGTGHVIDESVYGHTALATSSAGLVVAASVVEGAATSLAVTDGHVNVDDSYLAPSDWSNADPSGQVVAITPTSHANVYLDNVTLDGAGTFGAGLHAVCTGGGTATIGLVDAIAARATRDVEVSGPGCALTSGYDQYGTRVPAAGGATYTDSGPILVRPDDRTLLENARYLTPAWDSPARNAGSGRALLTNETDVSNQPRVVDGVRDLGAVEYQHRAPVADLLWVEDYLGTAHVGVPTELMDTGTDPDGERLTDTYTIDGAPVPIWNGGFADAPATANIYNGLLWTPLATGVHHVTVTATDPSGLTSTDALDVTVDPAPAPPVVSPPLVVPQQPIAPGRPPVVPARPIVRHLRPLFISTMSNQLTASGRMQVELTCGTKGGCTGALRVLLLNGKRSVKVGSGRFTKLAYGVSKSYTIRLTPGAVKAIVKKGWMGRRLRVVAYKGSGAKAKVWATAAGQITGLRVTKRS